MASSSRPDIRRRPSDVEVQSNQKSSETEHSHLGRNILAGGGSSLFRVAMQLALLPIMGRLLGPREFGIYATALPLISFFSVIADGGLGVSLAKEKGAQSVVWSTAFYAMITVGIGLAGLVSVSGILLATLMHEPRLNLLMSILSLSFPLIGISVLPAARLIRDNDLVSGSLIDVAATACGAAVALGFAIAGFGATSLALQYVVGYAIRAIGLNALAFEMPTKEFSLAALTTHLNTGGVLVGVRLLELFCRLGENVLFSLAFGPSALGAYTFANQVSRFLCEAASNPIWSALYAQVLHEPRNTTYILLVKMSRLMILLTFPVACFISASAPELLQYILGARWIDAGPMIQILIPSLALAGAASLGGAILLARDSNKAFFLTSSVLCIGRLIVVSAGPIIGFIGVGAAISFVNIIFIGMMVFVIRQQIGLVNSILSISLYGPIVAGFFGGCVVYFCLAILPESLGTTFLAIAIGGLGFSADLYLIEGRQVLDELVMVRKIILRR